MDPITTIGKLLDDTAKRDAIHIAIAPVIANERLSPGQPVGFCQDSKERVYGSLHASPIGIVDPFLRGPVFLDDRFWLFLYPHTITSLRHEWTHPAFSQEQPVLTKEVSEAWLRDFVARSDCPGYEAVLATAIGQGAEQWVHEYLHFVGMDAHGEIPPEFWDHVEVVTGQTIPAEKRATSFSCGC